MTSKPLILPQRGAGTPRAAPHPPCLPTHLLPHLGLLQLRNGTPEVRPRGLVPPLFSPSHDGILAAIPPKPTGHAGASKHRSSRPRVHASGHRDLPPRSPALPLLASPAHPQPWSSSSTLTCLRAVLRRGPTSRHPLLTGPPTPLGLQEALGRQLTASRRLPAPYLQRTAPGPSTCCSPTRSSPQGLSRVFASPRPRAM